MTGTQPLAASAGVAVPHGMPAPATHVLILSRKPGLGRLPAGMMTPPLRASQAVRFARSLMKGAPFSCYAWTNLIHSLQTSQDFLRRDSLSCPCRGERFRSLNRVASSIADGIASLVPRANDSDRLSNDLFAGMRFLHLCPTSMDARWEWQKDNAFPHCWTKRGGTRDEAPLHLGFPEECGRGNSPDMSSDGVRRMSGLSRGDGRSWKESERIAYRRIASSLSSRNRR